MAKSRLLALSKSEGSLRVPMKLGRGNIITPYVILSERSDRENPFLFLVLLSLGRRGKSDGEDTKDHSVESMPRNTIQGRNPVSL